MASKEVKNTLFFFPGCVRRPSHCSGLSITVGHAIETLRGPDDCNMFWVPGKVSMNAIDVEKGARSPKHAPSRKHESK